MALSTGMSTFNLMKKSWMISEVLLLMLVQSSVNSQELGSLRFMIISSECAVFMHLDYRNS